MGMEDVKWNSKIPLVTMETEGSNCFNEALKAGKIVTLNGINRPVHVLKCIQIISYLIFKCLGIYSSKLSEFFGAVFAHTDPEFRKKNHVIM